MTSLRTRHVCGSWRVGVICRVVFYASITASSSERPTTYQLAGMHASEVTPLQDLDFYFFWESGERGTVVSLDCHGACDSTSHHSWSAKGYNRVVGGGERDHGRSCHRFQVVGDFPGGKLPNATAQIPLIPILVISHLISSKPLRPFT